MLLDNLTKSTRSSKNVVLVTLILIGVIAVYNWLVVPHRNYLLAAQKYESAAGNLAKKNQIVAKKVKTRQRSLVGCKKSFGRPMPGSLTASKPGGFSAISLLSRGRRAVL